MFVISILAFGKAPIAWVSGTNGARVNFNLISCLGVGVGIFAAVFLLTNFRRVLQLSATKKAIGLIGAVGLIAHAVLALFLPLSYGGSGAVPVGTAGNQAMARSGPEQWIVDGESCKIASTYYLRLPEGLQYTIEYPYSFRNSDTDMNDDRALAVVFPIIKHAYTNGLYKRASISKLREGALAPSRIGVTLFDRRDGRVQGYRVALSLDEIRKRIGRTSISASSSPSAEGAPPTR